MVRIIELEKKNEILQPPTAQLRLIVGATSFICYLCLMVFGQYTSYVYYRTSHCFAGQCVYSSFNISQCSRCDNNYIDKYFLTLIEPQLRAAEIMYLCLQTYLFATAILFNSIGVYFFNFCFIGVFIGFQFANCLIFAMNCILHIGYGFTTFIFGNNNSSFIFWFTMYIANISIVCMTGIVYKDYIKVRQTSGEI